MASRGVPSVLAWVYFACVSHIRIPLSLGNLCRNSGCLHRISVFSSVTPFPPMPNPGPPATMRLALFLLGDIYLGILFFNVFAAGFFTRFLTSLLPPCSSIPLPHAFPPGAVDGIFFRPLSCFGEFHPFRCVPTLLLSAGHASRSSFLDPRK